MHFRDPACKSGKSKYCPPYFLPVFPPWEEGCYLGIIFGDSKLHWVGCWTAVALKDCRRVGLLDWLNKTTGFLSCCCCSQWQSVAVPGFPTASHLLYKGICSTKEGARDEKLLSDFDRGWFSQLLLQCCHKCQCVNLRLLQYTIPAAPSKKMLWCDTMLWF